MNKLWWKMFSIFPMIIENLWLRNQYLLLSMDSQNSGQNNDWKRICPPLKWNFIFARSKKQGRAVILVYLDDRFILLGNYLHATVFCSRNIELNLPKKKKKLVSIFLSKLSPLNLKVRTCSNDSSSTIFTWSYNSAFLCWKGWLVLVLGC